jgi:catechol 2,3-dioxygenase-like lactoylglutathione lyase family enzyme
VDAAVGFYERYIGLVETERDGDGVYLSCGEQHHDLILRHAATGEPGFDHVALEVAPHSLEHAVERAVAHGARHPRAVHEPGVREAVLLEAPGGFRMKLICGLQLRTRPRPTASGLPRPIAFSHVNLAAPDMDAVCDFFEEGLGMRRSDWLGAKEDPFLTWFHCDLKGAPHHGIAMFRTPDPGLHHLSFEYADVQQLGDRADDYVANAGRRLVWGMGRHGTGGSAFVYFEDPAGVMVELGQGMIRCGDDARWDGPRVWSMDDPDGVDLWGSSIPEPWLHKFIPVTGSSQVSV